MINRNASVRLTSDANLTDSFYGFVILETKGGSNISSVTAESYKASPEIVSATPLFQYNETLQGLMDEFMIKLKPKPLMRNCKN